MTGRNEGQDIRAYLCFCHRLPGFGVERGQQQREDIARPALGVLGQPPPFRDERVNRGIEEPQRSAYAQTADAGNEIGHAKQVERVDPPNSIEISCHGRAQLFGLASETIREDCVFKHIESHTRHLWGRIGLRCLAARAPSCHERVRRLQHGWRERCDGFAGKHRPEGAALDAPLLALRTQQAVR